MPKPRTGRTAVHVVTAVAIVAVFSSGGPGSWPPAGELLRWLAGDDSGRSSAVDLPGEFSRIDIGLLEGDAVTVGQTFGDDVLPMIRRPDSTSRPTVVTFD